MKFRIIKSSVDGVSGGDSLMDIDDICQRHIFFSRGWDSLKKLHEAIKAWSEKAAPGDVFKTHASVVVAAGFDPMDDQHACPKCECEDLDYGDLDPFESGDIEQIVSCCECGERWKDVFVLAERRKLCKVENK